ncbi:MAG: heavy-metal-associated domain-containing protein [Planctomycetaceae bacterium]|nr:heavy-metal-associated domain-containing protein [Planctomycetaceae bacterium]
MRRKVLSLIVLCGLAFVANAVTAEAAVKPSKTETIIMVGEMCGGCVKRITAKLEPMEGIREVRCDLKAKTVTVVPEPKMTLSPKTLWEALDSIGKTPKKLVGPSGTFTEKPKS